MATRRHADILILDDQSNLIAEIEVKSRPGLSRLLAADLYKSTHTDGASGNARFYLIVSQDTGFMWKQSEGKNRPISPDYEFPMASVIEEFTNNPDTARRLGGEELELLVIRWLSTLAYDDGDVEREPELILNRFGFLAAIKGAMIRSQVAL